MKRFKIKNIANGMGFMVERDELGAHQPEWGQHERDELGPDMKPTGKRLPAEYTIEVEDMTAEIQERERIKREDELNELLRKAAKSRFMTSDLSKVPEPMRTVLTDIRIILSKYS